MTFSMTGRTLHELSTNWRRSTHAARHVIGAAIMVANRSRKRGRAAIAARAAADAVAAVARMQVLKETADIVRRHYPEPPAMEMP